jgi:hypothetical protein
VFDVEYRRFLERVLDRLSAREDLEVYSAHLIENWGDSLRSPEEALSSDVYELGLADVLVAIDAHLSPGLQLELGHALGLGKTIVYAVPNELAPGSPSGLPYLNRGLQALKVHMVTYEAHDPDDCVRQLVAALEDLMTGWRVSRAERGRRRSPIRGSDATAS